jgi:peptidyl-prolyl cis-trans isomerase B (cyclophilin B)
VARQPVYGGRRQPEPATGFRGTIDRALPPFSIQRYAVIWLLGMIPLVLVILWLAQPWKSGSSSGGTAAAGDKFMVIDTAKGRIVAKLNTDPSAGVSKTIANFEQKANSGYFNGLVFHRVEDWVIQGGDPQGTGMGGGTMPSEYNQLTFKAGALGVARGGDPALNNDSQFFITKSDANWLDGQYTNWGQVTQGMDVVNQIAIGDKINSVSITDKQP